MHQPMAEELIAGVCSNGGPGGDWWYNPVSVSGFQGGGAATMAAAVPASCSAHTGVNGAAAFNWASALDLFDLIEPRPYGESSPVSISGGSLAFQDVHELSHVSALFESPALIHAQEDSSLIDPTKGENQIFSVDQNNSFQRGLTGTQLCHQEGLLELSNCSTDQLIKDESFRCSNQGVKKANKGAEKRSEISEPTPKKPRIETPSQLPTFKVRKEKLGDRITALQQLVSPFGKTDTASVLHEAIDYIKFLHDQVRVLSDPYLKKNHRNEQIKEQGEEEGLSSRGLCLVPVSATFSVARENPLDFWAPFLEGLTFR